MIECLHCGQRNHGEALYCNLCGEVLLRRGAQRFNEIGLSYNAAPRDDDLKQRASAARRFLVILALFALPPIAVLGLGWKGGLDLLVDGRNRFGPQTPLLILGGIAYLIFLNAYLTAKTGEAVGCPFFLNFVLASLPPLLPAVWARIAGCSHYKPYIYLIIDAGVAGLALYIFPDWAYLFLALTFALAPFLIYQFFGCGIGQIASDLGLYPSVIIGWLCLGPIFLLGILVCDMMGSGDPLIVVQPVSLTIHDLRGLLFDAEQIFSLYSFKVISLLYALITVFVWVKVVHEDLKLPPI